jgi:beta-N-acetylhexosaminidase
MKSAIFGFEGYSLTEYEKSFLREVNPFGIILFKRNCKDPEQLYRLTSSLREWLGRDDLYILIDQEGGLVSRLKKPKFKEYKAPSVFVEMAEENSKAAKLALYLNARLMGNDLHQLGINVNCIPVADIIYPQTNTINIGRSYGSTKEMVVELASEVARGSIDSGVHPVIKHIPGHGRASADSHFELPRVRASKKELLSTDFAVFRELNHIQLGMTAHVVYEDIDDEYPATISKKVIDVVRDEIDFPGVIMTDDLSMRALDGTYEERAKSSIGAGCDLLLHCNGDMEQMKAVAKETPDINKRVQTFLSQPKLLPRPIDTKEIEKELEEIMTAFYTNSMSKTNILGLQKKPLQKR